MVDVAVNLLVGAFRSQPYQGLALLMLTFGAFWIILFPFNRCAALWSAALATPFGLLDLPFYIPDYWVPVQWQYRFIGLGDVVFTFAAGGVAWLLATCPWYRRLVTSWHGRRFARRFIGGTVIGLSLACALWYAGVQMHLASALVMLLGLLGLSWRYPRLRLVSLLGAIGFGVFYLLMLRLSYWLAPAFAHQWNLSALSGILWIGVPAEEMLWALTYGAVWPRFIAYSLDACEHPDREDADRPRNPHLSD